MSGRCSRNCRTASRPFDACATRFMSGCVAKTKASPSRNIRWSSTARIRMASGFVFMGYSAPFLSTWTGVPETVLSTRSRQEWTARFLFRNCADSRPIAFLQTVQRAREYLVNHSVRRVCRRSIPPGRFPCRCPPHVNETVVDHTGDTLRSASLGRAGRHCVASRRRYGRLRRGRAEGGPWNSLPPAGRTQADSGRVDRQ